MNKVLLVTGAKQIKIQYEIRHIYDTIVPLWVIRKNYHKNCVTMQKRRKHELTKGDKILEKQILIVDDDMNIGNMLEEALTKEQYKVHRAYSGTEALMILERETPDLILLDLMLPGLSGEEVLPKISGIPVIVMSAKSAISDKVNLLMAGAQDYITKPFELSELMARIIVQLRKQENVSKAGLLKAGDVTLNTELLTATVMNQDISLTKTEVAILEVLMNNAGHPIGRSTILDRIADTTLDCTERSLKQHVSNIRKKLQAVSGEDYIEAIYGIGFRFKS